MDFATFLAAYFSAAAALVGVLLLGEHPALARTPVAGAHWLLTRGWVGGVEWAVGKARCS